MGCALCHSEFVQQLGPRRSEESVQANLCRPCIYTVSAALEQLLCTQVLLLLFTMKLAVDSC